MMGLQVNTSDQERFRGRAKLKTPEINTYAKQLQLCQRKYAKIPLEETPKARPLLPTLLPAKSGSSRKEDCVSSRRFSHSRRRSSCKSLPTTRELSLARRQSFKASLQNVRRTSLVRATTNTDNGALAAGNTILDKPRNVFEERGYNIGDKNVYRQSNFNVTMVKNNSCDFNTKSYVTTNSPRVDERYNETQRPSSLEVSSNVINAPPDSNVILYKPATLVTAFRNEDGHLLRALTTLAINDLISGTTASSGQKTGKTTALTNYDQPIAIITHQNGRTSWELQANMRNSRSSTIVRDEINKFSDSSTCDEDRLDCESHDSVGNIDNKRTRINKLRHYLKVSGFGDADMITKEVEKSEYENVLLLRLLNRMKRKLSPEKKERLKHKARLDYEMCIMRAESFCEQQGEVYLRTASADMGNQDLAMLEEDMRLQALHEIRADEIRELQRQHHQQRQQQRRVSAAGRWQKVALQHPGGDHTDGDVKIPEGELVKPAPDTVVDDAAVAEEDDGRMSGLLGSPLTRREMRKRILAWMDEVEKALGSSENRVGGDKVKSVEGANNTISDTRIIKEVKRINTNVHSTDS